MFNIRLFNLPQCRPGSKRKLCGRGNIGQFKPQFRWKVQKSDSTLSSDDRCALDDVAQLPNVAGPGMVHQFLKGLWIDPGDLALVPLIETAYECFRGKRGNIFLAPTKCRQRDPEHV